MHEIQASVLPTSDLMCYVCIHCTLLDMHHLGLKRSCALFRLAFPCNLKGAYIQHIPKFVSVLEMITLWIKICIPP